MKRITKIAILSIVMVLSLSVAAFAEPDTQDAASKDTLTVVSTSPEEGDTGTAQDNMGVKVIFSEPIYNEDTNEANAALCTLTDEDGNSVKTKVVFDEGHADEMLVLADVVKYTDIKGDTKYTMTIGEGFVSADGSKMDGAFSVSFTTLNPRVNMFISMGMMAVMMGIMVFATRKGMMAAMGGGQQNEEEEKTKAPEKITPYRVAKETGKSVSQVIAEDERRKQKEEAKAKKKAERGMVLKHGL